MIDRYSIVGEFCENRIMSELQPIYPLRDQGRLHQVADYPGDSLSWQFEFLGQCRHCMWLIAKQSRLCDLEQNSHLRNRPGSTHFAASGDTGQPEPDKDADAPGRPLTFA